MTAASELRAIAERAINLPAHKQDLFLARLDERGLDAALLPIVARADADAATPLSFAQRRMYLVERMSAQALYNLASGLELHGELNLRALRGALDSIVERHAVLRTVYREVDGVPQQQVLAHAPLALEERTLQGDADRQLRERLDAMQAQPFALDAEAPLRIELYRLGERRWALLWCVHHIAFDAWSEGVLQNELVQAYSALADGRAAMLAPLAAQYADYAAWEGLWQRSASFRRHSDYWRDALAGVPDELSLPFDRARPAAQARGHGGAEARRTLPASLTRRLYGLTANLLPGRETTLYTLLQTAFGWLLARYGNTGDLCMATSIANRQRAELEPLIGCLVNTLAIRHRVEASLRFDQAAAAAGDIITAAFEHAQVPFEHVLERLDIARDGVRPPLCQVLFVLQNVPDAGALALPGLSIAPLAQEQRLARFDLSLRIAERRDEAHLGLHLEYSTELFRAQTAERLLADFETVLEQVCAAPQIRFGEVVLGHEARNETVEPVAVATAQSLLWQAPAQAVAVEEGDANWTYAQLRAAAGRIAAALDAAGTLPGAHIALCLPRTFAQLAAMAAVWHRGAAWLPLDPQHPDARQIAVLDDSGAGVVVGWGAAPAWLPANVRWLDAESVLADTAPYAEPPRVDVGIDTPAYLIYTSGSTGTPKGVVVSQGNLAHYVAGVLPVLGLTEDASLATLSTVAADLGFTALFGALLSGRRVRLLPAELAFDAQALAAHLQAHPVDCLKIVPSHLAGLLAAGGGASVLPRECLVTGGEALSGALVQQVRALAPSLRIVNHYGPTETTVGVLTCTVPDEWPAEQGVPVGRPLAGNEAWVLDRFGLSAPVGVAGELYLGGGNLSLGYWQREEQTAERFVAHPFAPGRTLYRSGDLAKIDSEGRIVYLGRGDHQVKIRGYRVELGEVEQVLAQLPGVEVAAVLALPGANGVLQLGACVQGTLDGVADALAQRLPEYLCPTRWRMVESMPRLGNGKIDRQALAELLQQDETDPSAEADDETPVNETLRELWQKLLGREHIGAHENFFALGGDSILSLQVVARARQAGLALMPRQLYDHPTLAALSAQVQASAPAPAAAKPAPEAEQAFGLTPIQHWFFEQTLDEPAHWNMSVCIRIPERLQPAALETAVRAVAERHPMLRARFGRDASGTWQQRIGPWLPAQFAHRESDDAASRAESMRAWQASLDLDNGPLFRALYLTAADAADGRLLLVAHHLLIDGVSWRVLLEDLQRAYRDAADGRAPALAPPPSDFGQWQRHLREGLSPRRLRQWRDYWARPQSGDCAQLPFAASANRECDSASVHARLDRAATARLLGEDTRALRTQPQELLLAALATALARLCGANEILIELEGHGREPVDSELDLSETVGWFTSRYPARLRLPAGAVPAATLAAVKDQLRDIPDRGLGYGVLRYLHGELADLPVPQVCFNYLGQVRSGEAAGWDFAGGDDGGSRAPGTRRSHLLDVGAIVVDGELSVDWTYPADAIGRDAIQTLADDFIAALQALLALDGRDAAVPTRSDLALAALDDAGFDRLIHRYPDLEDVYPVSPLQQGLLFHALDAGEQPLYINQSTVTLDGEFDADAFAQAWTLALARHPILRTGFAWDGLERPLQVVRSRASLSPRRHDLRDRDEAGTAAILAEIQREDRNTPFALDEVPLMRVRLLQCAPRRHIVVWTRHHLIVDGWSSALLIQEVMAGYRALARGQRPTLPAAPPYRDYLGWLARQDRAGSSAWWSRELAALDAPARLPEAADPRPGFAHVRREFDATAVAALAAAHAVTLGTVVQGALALVLRRYYGRDDFCIGLTSSGRPAELPGVERMLGVFINTLPLRLRFDRTRPEQAPTLGAWLAQLQRHGLDLREYEHLPLAEVQALSGLVGGVSPFDTLLVFENYPAAPGEDGGELRVREHDGADLTHYPLTLAMLADESRLHVQAVLDRGKLDGWLVEQMLDDLAFVLQQLPSLQRLDDLPLLPSQSRSAAWTERASYPCVGSLVARFAEVAQRHPARIAVSAEDGELDYAALDRRSSQLATLLIRQGAGPGQRVGLCLPRGCDLLVALLAILKTGAAYVPVDPQAPAARRGFVLEDSGVCLSVSLRALAVELPGTALCLDDPFTRAQLDAAMPGDLPEVPADAPAYLIYTSGSTGTPKGVVVTHRNVERLFTAATQDGHFSFDESDVWSLFHSHAFDFAVWELWGAWLYGGRAVLVPEAVCRQPDAFLDLLAEQGITVLNQTPSAFYALQSQALRRDVPLKVKTVVFGGEALEPSRLQPWRERYPDVELINMYGITETTVHVSFHRLSDEDLQSPASRIGRALPDLAVHVLDDAGQPVPLGVVGELVVEGDGVAQGYWQRPELTAERFVVREGQRRYRSGDLGRYRVDGSLEYRGRGDDQVKLRGYRIEPGEIAAKLAALPQVVDAAVTVEGQGEGAWLMAYAVAAPNAEPDPQALRDALRAVLPDYMLPRQIQLLPALPLTANGKLDRKALPKPEATQAADRRMPRNALEWQLLDAWRQVLARSDFGIDDDFFALGGHSLLATSLLSRLRRLRGQDLPLALVFQHPTIARMSEHLGAQRGGANALVRLRGGGAATQRLFCLHPGGGHTLAYAPALERLDAEVAAFGINSRMLVDNQWRPASLDALLDDYLALIRAEQPEGPYALLGWSLGGTLAYALAERLEQAGDQVAWVGLIDCFGWREKERIADPALHGLRWLPEYFAYLEPAQREPLYAQPQQLVALDVALVEAADEAARQAVLAAHYATLAGQGVADAERHLLQLRLFRSWDEVLAGYRPGRLAAPVAHWQAADSVALFGGGADAWQAHAAVEQTVLAGDHYSIMQSPALADAVAAAARRARAAEVSPCR
ncbi:non-ribosomal peptide synthetase [Lysobacter enzymogenes]|uniref:non-ribosomal peptide synthetase n=1 Tax=Lysobacter enzymogenes TaxID=69 RepID=UPI001AF808FB|nr:non-ribosomal peptide synthetase [Lysobacter enzymogenes]QQQ03726.1 amino acid adenylation domain-containing protein [Lysobacter enzymogenes]